MSPASPLMWLLVGSSGDQGQTMKGFWKLSKFSTRSTFKFVFLDEAAQCYASWAVFGESVMATPTNSRRSLHGKKALSALEGIATVIRKDS
jgi:hypothetical protein